MIHLPASCRAASLLPNSASSSANHGAPRVRKAVDLSRLCLPSRTSAQSALAPGWMMRATAEIIHLALTARTYGVWCAEIDDGPSIEPRRSVPFAARQIVEHGMESVLARHGFDRLAGDVGADENALLLQPFCGADIVDVRQRLAELWPHRFAYEHHAEMEEVIGEGAAPFRRLGEGHNRVREDRTGLAPMCLDEFVAPIGGMRADALPLVVNGAHIAASLDASQARMAARAFLLRCARMRITSPQCGQRSTSDENGASRRSAFATSAISRKLAPAASKHSNSSSGRLAIA